jgi:hypothetical protein
MNLTSARSRILVAGGLALACATLAAGPASAVSEPIPYSCTWTVGEAQGAGTATATWDSGVPEDFTVPPNVSFSLAPFTGTVVLPDTFVQGLRDQGVTELGGTGELQIIWDAAGGSGEDVIGLAFAATAVPTSGPMTLDLTGVSGLTTSLNEQEPWSMVAWDFSLTGEAGPSTLSCRPPNALGVIDTVNTMVAPTTTPASPTTTTATATATGADGPSTTTSPVRPALVQTDQPQPGTGALPLVGLGLGAAVALGGVVAVARAGRARRH